MCNTVEMLFNVIAKSSSAQSDNLRDKKFNFSHASKGFNFNHMSTGTLPSCAALWDLELHVQLQSNKVLG